MKYVKPYYINKVKSNANSFKLGVNKNVIDLFVEAERGSDIT